MCSGYQGQVKNTTSVTPCLEVVVANLQDYCTGILLVCSSLFDFDLNDCTVNLKCFIALPLKSRWNVQIDSLKSDWSSFS